MEKNHVLNVITQNLYEIMPELKDSSVNNRETLVDMGLNSLDRGELITLTLERLQLEIPRVHFVSANSIDELADLIVAKA